jgi:hypothetical protein
MDRWQYRYVSEMLAFYRRAREITEAGGTIRLEWGGRSYDAEGWHRQFRAALDRRINLKAGPPPEWRKLDDHYQVEMIRDCQAIRDNQQRRAALHQIITPELRRRFGHLISGWDDGHHPPSAPPAGGAGRRGHDERRGSV